MAGEEHKKLVTRAAKWLRGTAKCSFVLEEPICVYIGEEPDAIGWRQGGRESIVVECKVSRADFRRDRKKVAARLDGRLGMYRFYLTPKGLLKAADLPDGWGLLEIEGNRVLQSVRPLPRGTWDRAEGQAARFEYPERSLMSELSLMMSAAVAGGDRMFRYFEKQAMERAAVATGVVVGELV